MLAIQISFTACSIRSCSFSVLTELANHFAFLAFIKFVGSTSDVLPVDSTAFCLCQNNCILAELQEPILIILSATNIMEGFAL